MAKSCVEALQVLIAQSRSPEAAAASASDFPLAQLNQEELDKLLARIDKQGM
jgi:hypothetical protein